MPIRCRASVGIACIIALWGCSATRKSNLGEVYAGPMNLPLRADITPKSKIVATVHHGDKLYIVQQRRRLYRVRTESNSEGWTDERNLMSSAQMAALRELERRAALLPSQGTATTLDPLNVHTEPQRYSPSFVQIQKGEKFEILAHQTSGRAEPSRRTLVAPPKRDANGRKRGSRSDRKKNSLPPAPAPPRPPSDWEELSRSRSSLPAPVPAEKPSHRLPPEPAPEDDWTLIRTPKHIAGWVLTNRVYLSIPDEVAQYAEGRRIVTYFSLGKVHDVELNLDKDIWLWTTIHSGRFPYDFDSYRVFSWNPKRHRWETSYIQRGVEGYLPVIVSKLNGEMHFAVCLANDDGSRAARTFYMLDRQVKYLGNEPCKNPENEPIPTSTPSSEPQTAPTVTQKLKDKAGEVKAKILGR